MIFIYIILVLIQLVLFILFVIFDKKNMDKNSRRVLELEKRIDVIEKRYDTLLKRFDVLEIHKLELEKRVFDMKNVIEHFTQGD